MTQVTRIRRPCPATRHHKRLLAASALGLAGFTLASLAAPGAHASGYALYEGSADQTANAYAGSAAKAYDASTAFANPAGMALLDQNEIQGDISAILPSFSFHGADYLGPGVTVPGTSGHNVVESAIDPAFFGVWNFSPSVKFGIAVNAPFGQRVSNGLDFVGRYQSLVSSIDDYEVTLSAAWRVNPYLAIGGGPVVDYFQARLTQAINTGPTAALTGDPVVDLHSDPNIALGYNLGALITPSDTFRIGFDYRSRIAHALSGAEQVSVPGLLAELSPLTAYELGAAFNSAVTTKVTLPDSLNIATYWQVTPRLALMSTLQWTDWSLFQHLVITQANGQPPNVTPENWRNTWMGSIGASYRILPALLLQTGFGYEQSPVTTATRNTRLPDYNRLFSGLGLTYSALRCLDVTVGWNHLFAAGAEINNSATPTAGVIIGRYENHADSVALGATLKF